MIQVSRATVARRRLHVLPVVEQLDLALYRNRLAVQRVRLTADGHFEQSADARLDRCPFRDEKPTCSNCLVHCYKPDMRERIREVMREHVRATCPQVELREGVVLKQLTRRRDGRVCGAQLERRPSGEEFTITADVIIGADGIHSAVRDSLFGPIAPRFTGCICWRGMAPAEAVAGLAHATDMTAWWGRTAMSCTTPCGAAS